jgi:hypothetical protein
VDPRALDDVEKRKFLNLPGLELRPLAVVQPVASRYTDYAIPAPFLSYGRHNLNRTNEAWYKQSPIHKSETSSPPHMTNV